VIRLRKTTAILILVIIVLLSCLVLEFQKAREFEEKYLEIDEEYEVLSEKFSELIRKYNETTIKLENVTLAYDNLKNQYSLVLNERNNLLTELEELNKSYILLKAECSSLEEKLDRAITEMGRILMAYSRMRDVINQRIRHEDPRVFVRPDDPLVVLQVGIITRRITKPATWNEILEDVKAMYDWVVNNVEYNYDTLYPVLPKDIHGQASFDSEVWLFPNETITMKYGDCEDQAILLTSMLITYFRRINVSASCEVIVLLGGGTGHAATYIRLKDGKICILDTAGHYYTSDTYGKLTFRDARIEIYKWIDYWSEYIRNPSVREVFSDQIYKRFDSTQEFLEWLYGGG